MKTRQILESTTNMEAWQQKNMLRRMLRVSDPALEKNIGGVLSMLEEPLAFPVGTKAWWQALEERRSAVRRVTEFILRRS